VFDSVNTYQLCKDVLAVVLASFHISKFVELSASFLCRDKHTACLARLSLWNIQTDHVMEACLMSMAGTQAQNA
jgi:hypothetical protein